MGQRSQKLPGLRGAREREGISLRELSRRSGVALNNLSRLENSKQGAYRPTIFKLAEELHCSFLDLVRPGERMSSWRSEALAELLPEVDSMVVRSSALPDELLIYLHGHIVKELHKRDLPAYEVANSERNIRNAS